MTTTTLTFDIYVRATPDQVWQALTDPAFGHVSTTRPADHTSPAARPRRRPAFGMDAAFMSFQRRG